MLAIFAFYLNVAQEFISQTFHFSSFCTTHRSNQDLSVLPKQQQQQQHQPAGKLPSEEEYSSYPCPLCLDDVVYDAQDVLKTPCCNNIFIHRACVQVRPIQFLYFFSVHSVLFKKD